MLSPSQAKGRVRGACAWMRMLLPLSTLSASWVQKQLSWKGFEMTSLFLRQSVLFQFDSH